MNRSVRIATRGSKLALWQANHVRSRLHDLDPTLGIELVVLSTAGDRTLDRPLAEVGGKGLFVKEIEEALLDRRADVAVHSMKDLPASLPDGLALAAIPERVDPRDAFLVRPGLVAAAVGDLPPGARVGTSSLRRLCQLRHARPDLEILPLRGNVDTRLGKLADGQFDAIVLAMAGLLRLGFGDRITAPLEAARFVPAIGQGALAIETRGDDGELRHLLAPLHHEDTAAAVTAERAFLGRLEGSCRTPLAAFARRLDGDRLAMSALVGHPDGSAMLREEGEGDLRHPEALGVELAERLLARGAARYLDLARELAAPPRSA